MNLGATKHMTLYMVTLDTHEIIYPCDMRLDNGSMVKPLEWGQSSLEFNGHAKQLEFVSQI